MTEATQEVADALLRNLLDWNGEASSRLISAIIRDARAYLARRPEPVDPDLLIAREAAADDHASNILASSILAGSRDDAPIVRIALRAIKLSREKQ